MNVRMLGVALYLGLLVAPAWADDTVKIGYIDPLSGGGASIGEIGLKTFQYLADELNAAGGLDGKKIEIVPLDNKTNAQESLIQAQKAADDGAHFITQGNGSSVAAALTDWVSKYNDRNPGKEILYLNYAAVDPVLTNDKCSFWHFRWDANSDIKMAALTTFMKSQPNIKKVYLINQDYSFGHSVEQTAKAMLKEKRPDIEIVGDEFHPLLKVTDFSPYIAKIKASGADSVITGNWGQDIALLLKAAADAGLQANWYTYYAGGAGGPTAIKQTGLSHRVFAITEGVPNSATPEAQKWEATFRAKEGVSLLLSARGQRNANAGEGCGRSQVDRREGGRREARGHEDRGFRRRRGVHAQGRPPVLPADVHQQLRGPRSWREIRRGRHRLGVETSWIGQGGRHGPADDLQDGPSLTDGGRCGGVPPPSELSLCGRGSSWPQISPASPRSRFDA